MQELANSFVVLEEKYMELNTMQLDNRLLVSKWTYISYWTNAIIKAKLDGHSLILTDRCPLDNCAYIGAKGKALLDLVEICFSELKELNIEIVPVLVTADFNTLQSRIDRRLVNEPGRALYNENDIEHNRSAYDFFHLNMRLWSQVIDTTEKHPDEVIRLFESAIKRYAI
ncbi:hypothetical protein [Dyadobacter sp. 50-39]|uniref:hypothetical protein n=1 Tax=Dyadobacter sp. 50-39 TaxID=1895756 RepID=UPI0025B8C7AC|nr:hypothetical protein [Dyadobacter sp. 50-39]